MKSGSRYASVLKISVAFCWIRLHQCQIPRSVMTRLLIAYAKAMSPKLDSKVMGQDRQRNGRRNSFGEQMG